MQEELTVRVEHPELPAIRWNEAEVQQNLTEMLAAYTGRVYTPETIKDAKADRAAVNKLDKQLSDAARSAKAFYMKPLEEFLQSAKQMQGQCKAVSGAIDHQVKAVEEAERQDKADALRAVYADCIGELREMIPFDRLLVPQWLNKTYDLAKASREYEKIRSALEQVEATGYGIVMPTIDELSLEQPEIVQQGGRYGVRLEASAPSIQMMKATIHTEISPIVGTEKQSEDLVQSLLQDFESDPVKLWESNIFGKSLHELVNDGLQNKLLHMPQEARTKMQETLEQVINEGCTGLICILL